MSPAGPGIQEEIVRIEAGMWAVVRGASSGSGGEGARQRARRGCSLVLASRDETSLQALADELRGASPGAPAAAAGNAHPDRVTCVAGDLSESAGVARLREHTEALGIVPDLLINNAGFGTWGRFHRLDPDREAAMLRLNIETLVALSRLYLPGMLEKRRGSIVQVASTAGFLPLPYMATYAATKAFVISFGESLWEECRGTGVEVMTLCPGSTRTDFQRRAGVPPVGPDFRFASAESVVRAGLRGLERGKRVVVPGLLNRLMVAGQSVLPRRWGLAVAARLLDPERQAG
jgi:short-subunit dehydrogenase